MNFIKLHNEKGRELRINFDLIESYGTIFDEEYYGDTFIYPVALNGDENQFHVPYIVKESTAFIDTKIAVMQHESKL